MCPGIIFVAHVPQMLLYSPALKFIGTRPSFCMQIKFLKSRNIGDDLILVIWQMFAILIIKLKFHHSYVFTADVLASCVMLIEQLLSMAV